MPAPPLSGSACRPDRTGRQRVEVSTGHDGERGTPRPAPAGCSNPAAVVRTPLLGGMLARCWSVALVALDLGWPAGWTASTAPSTASATGRRDHRLPGEHDSCSCGTRPGGGADVSWLAGEPVRRGRACSSRSAGDGRQVARGVGCRCRGTSRWRLGARSPSAVGRCGRVDWSGRRVDHVMAIDWRTFAALGRRQRRGRRATATDRPRGPAATTCAVVLEGTAPRRAAQAALDALPRACTLSPRASRSRPDGLVRCTRCPRWSRSSLAGRLLSGRGIGSPRPG